MRMFLKDNPSRWVVLSQIHGVFMICMEICGNGLKAIIQGVVVISQVPIRE